MRVIVVDTSVFISALIGKPGASREILRQCLHGQYKPLMGTSLFHEYESVFARNELFNNCPINSNERDILFNAFINTCQWVHLYYLWRPNLRDECDNHVLELAIAGNATAIITKNIKDFKNGQLFFPDVRILKPEQLLKGEVQCLL